MFEGEVNQEAEPFWVGTIAKVYAVNARPALSRGTLYCAVAKAVPAPMPQCRADWLLLESGGAVQRAQVCTLL